MIGFITYIAPVLLVAMGSFSVLICYQALRLVVPHPREALTDAAKDPRLSVILPAFTAGGCAVVSQDSRLSKEELLVTSSSPPPAANASAEPFEDAVEP